MCVCVSIVLLFYRCLFLLEFPFPPSLSLYLAIYLSDCCGCNNLSVYWRLLAAYNLASLMITFIS